jgi:hypothetical protein
MADPGRVAGGIATDIPITITITITITERTPG